MCIPVLSRNLPLALCCTSWRRTFKARVVAYSYIEAKSTHTHTTGRRTGEQEQENKLSQVRRHCGGWTHSHILPVANKNRSLSCVLPACLPAYLSVCQPSQSDVRSLDGSLSGLLSSSSQEKKKEREAQNCRLKLEESVFALLKRRLREIKFIHLCVYVLFGCLFAYLGFCRYHAH